MFSCREFDHIARNCKNQRIMEQERRMEYRNKKNNLNGEESPVVLN